VDLKDLCTWVEQNKDQLFDILEDSLADNRERGVTFCQVGPDQINITGKCIGNECAVRTLPCTTGVEVGSFHTHGSGDHPLSPDDFMVAMQREHKISCFGHRKDIDCILMDNDIEGNQDKMLTMVKKLSESYKQGLLIDALVSEYVQAEEKMDTLLNEFKKLGLELGFFQHCPTLRRG
jgi:hypothetical protein